LCRESCHLSAWCQNHQGVPYNIWQYLYRTRTCTKPGSPNCTEVALTVLTNNCADRCD
jgi:hypothetical protein